MKRTEIIQALINKIKAKKYLEIGVGDGNNFRSIICSNKVCVDPNLTNITEGLSYKLTSDEFFSRNTEFFDVIFIDGLHEYETVYRDIKNSLNCLNPGGYIVCHDINPISEITQRYPQVQSGEWTGDCWKAWVKIRSELGNVLMFVVDTDYGCGVITEGNQKLIDFPDNLSYETLEKDRKALLNLISVEHFINKLC
jgi:hypothetical protein